MQGRKSGEEKRARRIRDLLRMKAKAKRIGKQRGVDWKDWPKWAEHLAMCSGPCCGNPRRWFKPKEALTMQERRIIHETYNAGPEQW